MASFLETLRSVTTSTPSQEEVSEAQEWLKAEKAREEGARKNEFLDSLLAILNFFTAGSGRNAGETEMPIPKAPSSPMNKQSQEDIRGQKQAATDYYRNQGYDIAIDDIVRHPGGGYSMKNYGRGVKRLSRPSIDLKIAETYKGAQ